MPDQTRLLVVDDDADIRELLSAYLARYDMTVETAADGAGLFEKLDHAHFDLIILDIMLPGEDGLSLCRRLRGTSAIPVIFLTSLDSSTGRAISTSRASWALLDFSESSTLFHRVLRSEKAGGACAGSSISEWTTPPFFV